jgi:hypothetical protein
VVLIELLAASPALAAGNAAGRRDDQSGVTIDFGPRASPRFAVPDLLCSV